MAGFNHLRPGELMAHRKILSDYKSDTDELTIEKKDSNANAAAYKNNREKLENIYFEKMAASNNYSDLEADLAELELLEVDSANG